ncbi:class I SAM-dependent methyltransferase [Beijerinckia sp. L45]|uniref:class I SAM-dependent methyltransferase n=1 Tax=Beijerinckia sp. L45 TaxID=1641855 RepID=UPI00131E7CA2|nr:class I SAM-dependent methyltransferase [Beijerinckia sp. L45]
MLRSAGIEPGMRILDVGCGAGDVAMLAADLVGPTGSVVGIDRAADGLALAKRRTQYNYPNIAFQQAGLDDYAGHGDFDMVICRYVLIHQADPVGFLRAAARLTRSGGIVAVHEISTRYLPVSEPPVALWDQIGLLLTKAISVLVPGADIALRAPRAFRDAGLPQTTMVCEMVTGRGPGALIYRWVADTCQVFMPSAQKIAPSGQALPGFDGLAERLEAAVLAADAQVATWAQVCVWAPVPR